MAKKQEKPKQTPPYDEEQFKLLLKCSEAKDMTEWNEWRKENRNIKINLRGIKHPEFPLEKFYLQDANLRSANLQDARLGRANLQDANLLIANLQDANLPRANLQDAILWEANLQGADLVRANLQGANLWDANLQDAVLQKANLQDAYLWEANLQDAKLWDTNLQGAKLWKANLQDAKLGGANLQDAKLWEANLQGANLQDANLQDANLEMTNLQGADLRKANLQGAYLAEAELQRAKFNLASVDGKTLIDTTSDKVDRETDFTGVPLANVRIKPELKQLLEYNVRRKRWGDWYRKHKFWRLVAWPFWMFSDYGRSTGRIVAAFFIIAWIFSLIYCAGAVWAESGNYCEPRYPLIDNLHNIGDKPISNISLMVRSFYFSVVTMTTLGFGDMYAHAESEIGQLFLILQVILGYLLLGALITRLSILFTAGGPSASFKKKKEEEQ